MVEISSKLNWSIDIFIECYNSITLLGKIDDDLCCILRGDLLNILIAPGKNESSKSKVLDESKPVTFSNGDEFKLNRSFVESAILLSTEIDLDEIMTAELLYYSEALSFQKGTSLKDSAIFVFFQRFQYILNILGFLITNRKLESLIGNDYDLIFNNIIGSFERIYKLLNIANDLIDKQRNSSDINNLVFVNTISFTKNELFAIHELLGKIYFGLIDSYLDQFGKEKYFNKMISHVSSHIPEEDSLVIHYLPGLLSYATNLKNLLENEVIQTHKTFADKLSSNHDKVFSEDIIDLSRSNLKSIEIVLAFIFFTNFISWCKEDDRRTKKYDFKEDIVKYLEWCINYGVMEKLLCYTSDTSNKETKKLFEWNNLYDFRSLLQRNFPKLKPVKFLYAYANDLNVKDNSNITKLVDTKGFITSCEFVEELLAPLFHCFFVDFITNAAVILTLMRDTEEDFLLSSVNKKQLENKIKNSNNEDNLELLNKTSDPEDSTQISDDGYLDLDQISSRGDLERFYLAFAYTYNNRPDLCNLFLPKDELSGDKIGFISWGLCNNTSPLITATFCLLLGSLASSGDEIASIIWEVLTNNNNSSNLKKNDFSRISIDSIIDSLNYYIDSLNDNFEQDLNDQIRKQQRRQEFLFISNSAPQDSEEVSNGPIIIELSEDSIVFISGFVQLISSIVRNLSTSKERSNEIKKIAFNRFSPIINGFLKFDNFTSNTTSQANVVINTDNKVVLTNLILSLMSDFVFEDDNLEIRYKIWEITDRWLCHTLNDTSSNNSSETGTRNAFDIISTTQFKNKYPLKRGIKISQGFTANLTHLSQVGNFVELLKNLLRPLKSKNKAFTKHKLLFPANLGFGYRPNNQVGIWPYIEYLLLEVFAKSEELAKDEDKYNLQFLIIETLESSLGEIDWHFINDIAPMVINNLNNLDSIVESMIPNIHISYNAFVKLHQSLAIMNYLFDERTYTTLCRIVCIGSNTLSESEDMARLLQKTLNVINQIMELQDTYINRLLPIIKSDYSTEQGTTSNSSLTNISNIKEMFLENIYYPNNVGTKGLNNFFEVFLFNLTTVVHFALYVGSSNVKIASKSIEILGRISKSPYFISKFNSSLNDPVLNNNRLLTIFENIDESERIKYAFIEQFEISNDNNELKYNILQFLIDNLSGSNRNEPSISHFLLGFTVRGGNLLLDISSDKNTLLTSVLQVLSISLELISEIDYANGNSNIIDIEPAKMASMILEIVVKLCQDSISSSITLNYLRNYGDLFEKIINCQPKIDLHTIWFNCPFNGNLQDDLDNEFIQSSSSSNAFFSFINHRNLILQYFSLEFHNISSISKKEYYIDLLLKNKDFLDGSAKILNFLDILNFRFSNFEIYKYEKYNKKYNLTMILEQIKMSSKQGLDLSILNDIYKIVCQNSSITNKEMRESFSKELMYEGVKISEFLSKFFISEDLKNIQLKCLHSWCQLIEILITDPTLSSRGFTLEVFQVMIPKINDYLETEISFSEELISLSVLLFDFYEQDVLIDKNSKDYVIGIQKLVPLFKTCINGILNSNSTPTLRSDLYVLANKFMVKIFNKEELERQFSIILKSIDRKFIDIICNDSIYSEGTSRITSILLLESLVHLSSKNKANFVLEILTKNNSLLLLVRSIKRTDEMLTICSKNNSGISLEILLYELTAFKCTLYLLLRVSQTKVGSLQLIQSDLFSILKESKFLKIDPDLGLVLRIDESNDASDVKNAKINLLLDTPQSMSNLYNNLHDENEISYYEFLIPIFQLISTIALSMGPEYKPSITQIKELLQNFNTLIVGIMKRDILIEESQLHNTTYENEDSFSSSSLKELVRLFTLLDSLANYKKIE